GDDFHIGMRVRRKPGAGRDLVVVPDAQRTPAHSFGIVVMREGEVMAGIEPIEAFAAEAGEGTAFDHVTSIISAHSACISGSGSCRMRCQRSALGASRA